MFCQNEPPVSAATRRPRWGWIEVVPKPPPASTKISLRQRLTQRAQARWPVLATVSVHYRGVLAYIDGHLSDGTILPLYRLRYNGSASIWVSRSTWPAATDTKTTSCPAAYPPAAPKKASTASAASTSTTPPAGPYPRRINGADHLGIRMSTARGHHSGDALILASG